MKNVSIIIFFFCVVITLSLNKAICYANTGETPIEKAFRGQIITELSAAITRSPSSIDSQAWEKMVDWGFSKQAFSLFALIQISPNLIETAVEYWAEKNPSFAGEEKLKIINRLREKFLRSNTRTFLLIVKPIKATGRSDKWAVSLDPINENFRIYSFSGKPGSVVIAERSPLDIRLYSFNSVVSCLLVTENPANSDDPVFNVEISNIYYWIKLNSDVWVKAKEAQKAFFRFEPDKVKILALIEKEVPWKDIEEVYLLPRLRAAQARTGFASIEEFIVGVAVDIFSSWIFSFIF